MRTSMQKDFDAGRPLELDAIGGAIVRAGRRQGIRTPVTDELIRRVEARLAARQRELGSGISSIMRRSDPD
jgi:2-dehydropantoate 2-reductase